MASDKGRKNRIAINVEDSIYEAFTALADKEGVAVSDLGRSIIVSYLNDRQLLPEETIRRLAGILA